MCGATGAEEDDGAVDKQDQPSTVVLAIQLESGTPQHYHHTSMSHPSETSLIRATLLNYCQGNGIDVGSGGDPIKRDGCISFDLGGPGKAPLIGECVINCYGDARNLNRYFSYHAFDYLYSSHLLEDFADWEAVLTGWCDVVRPGGLVILAVPDKVLYNSQVMDPGAVLNPAHKHEFLLGELPAYFAAAGWALIEERASGAYTIVVVAQKPT